MKSDSNNSLSSLDHFIDPISGIISNIQHFVMEPSDPEVFAVWTTLSNMNVYGGGKSRKGGVGMGLTLDNAMRAAVGESIETYALALVDPSKLLFGNYQQLSSEKYEIVYPDEWSLFHPSQYKFIPYSQFTIDTKISWIKADSLTYKKEKLVPASFVYLPFMPRYHNIEEKIIVSTTTTGAACGISISDAILRGIFEIIERESFIIIWRNKIPCPKVIIDEKCNIYSIFQKKFCRPGLKYLLFYTKLDLNIHSFLGVLIDSRGSFPSIVVSAAAHLDPEVAVLKTLLELVQTFKYKNILSRQPYNTVTSFRNIRSFIDRVKLYAFNNMYSVFSFLFNHNEMINLSSIPSFDSKNSSVNLKNCVWNLKDNGLEVLGVNITPPDISQNNLEVIRVLIPQADTIESDYNFPLLGGKRWLEVPVKLGLRNEPLDIKLNNPYPHPFP